MTVVNLTIEQADNGFWGTVMYDNNLIVEHTQTEQDLKDNIKNLLREYHQLEPETIFFNIEII